LARLPSALAKARTLRRIDHDDRQARRRKARRDDRLIAAGRLHGDRLGLERREPGDQPAQTLCVPFDGERLPVGRTATSSRSFDAEALFARLA
jgi:hypothetical protein